MMRLRVRTPSRLHFGLFGWEPAALPAVRWRRPASWLTSLVWS